jgi:hypothetical protein
MSEGFELTKPSSGESQPDPAPPPPLIPAAATAAAATGSSGVSISVEHTPAIELLTAGDSDPPKAAPHHPPIHLSSAHFSSAPFLTGITPHSAPTPDTSAPPDFEPAPASAPAEGLGGDDIEPSPHLLRPNSHEARLERAVAKRRARLDALKLKYQVILQRRNRVRYRMFMLLNGKAVESEEKANGSLLTIFLCCTPSSGHDPVARYIQLFLVVLIVFNIILFIFSTEKEFYSSNSAAFDACEACACCCPSFPSLAFSIQRSLLNSMAICFPLRLVSVAVFTLEYLVRLWCVVEHSHYRNGPCAAPPFCDTTAQRDRKLQKQLAQRERRRRQKGLAAGGGVGGGVAPVPAVSLPSAAASMFAVCSCCEPDHASADAHTRAPALYQSLGVPQRTGSSPPSAGAAASAAAAGAAPRGSVLCRECGARLCYMVSFMSLVDLVSILPFYMYVTRCSAAHSQREEW